MKIKWTNGRKTIPKIGEVNTGDVLDVTPEVANAFISQGQAKKFAKKKIKGGEEKWLMDKMDT